MAGLKERLKRLLLRLPGFQELCRRVTNGHVRVLMYHRFSERADGNPRATDAGTLSWQLDYIARYHSVWCPIDQYATSQGRAAGGRCPVVLTVDDGYRDFYEIAYPRFRERSLPVMLFVVTGFVDGITWFWWDRLAYLFGEAAQGIARFPWGSEPVTVDLSTPDDRMASWNRVADRLRFLPDDEKEAALAELARTLNVEIPAEPPPEYAPVTWDQIHRMGRENVLYGAHTINHPILSRVPLAVVRKEIEESRDRLAEKTGRSVDWFCYPQGGPADFTPEVQEMVRAAGFKGCYISYQDLNYADDFTALPRYSISRDTTHFQWVLCGAEYLMLRLRGILGLKTGPGPAYWAGHERTALPVRDQR